MLAELPCAKDRRSKELAGLIACMPKWDATEKDASERSIGCERFVVLPRGGDYERCRDRWGFRTIVYRVSIYSRIGLGGKGIT